MSEVIDALAQQWASLALPRGLDWSRLEGGVEGTAYLDAMLRETTKLYTVVGKLDIEQAYRTLRLDQGRASLAELGRALQQSGAPALAAAKKDVWDLSANDALSMTKEGMKNAMATMAAYAANGAQLHFDGVMYQGLMTGQLSAAEVQEHADQVVRACQTFEVLEKEGALDEIRRQSAVAGLGIAPLAIPVWMLVVAGVFLVMGLAYLWWSTHRASVLQDKVVAWCDRLIATDPANAGACIQSLENMANDSLGNLFAPVQSVVKWLGVGLLVYVGALAIPSIVKGFASMRKKEA